MITKARTSSDQSLADSEQITDTGRMVLLLERLAKQHSLLTVDIPGHQEHYTSSIVSVDRPYVLLDELLPATGHQLLCAERTLQISGKLDGIDIRFITSLERVENRDNMVTYHMNLPGQIEYRQRRLAYRAHIPIAQTLRVIIDSREGIVAEGVLHDLSHGGAGMIFAGGRPPAAVPGLLYECAIELPDDVWLHCTVELCYSKSIRSRDGQLIGARFNELSPAQARLVGHCVSKLEREFVRKRAAE
jgi:c-di-GMP-binding flagellar brake protein YcgR